MLQKSYLRYSEEMPCLFVYNHIIFYLAASLGESYHGHTGSPCISNWTTNRQPNEETSCWQKVRYIVLQIIDIFSLYAISCYVLCRKTIMIHFLFHFCREPLVTNIMWRNLFIQVSNCLTHLYVCTHAIRNLLNQIFFIFIWICCRLFTR